MHDAHTFHQIAIPGDRTGLCRLCRFLRRYKIWLSVRQRPLQPLNGVNHLNMMLGSVNWFGAVGSYRARSGQLALADLQAWAGSGLAGDTQIQPSTIASSMAWLPSSRDQRDPIHGASLVQLLKQNGAPWQQQVMQQYKLALQSLRAVPDKTLCSGRNDFTPAAIGAALYCVRMASLEILAGRRGF